MPGLFVLLALGAVGVMILMHNSGPKAGDSAEVNGIDLVFRQAGAGFGWAPVDSTNAAKFSDGMIVDLRGAHWKWFSGIGAFVQV